MWWAIRVFSRRRVTTMVIRSRLRLHAGQLLVDAGCGAGGIGLWPARAVAVRLTGFDLSPIAVARATARRAHFLGPVGDRAVLQVAELKKSGLPDGAAHGIVRVDALGEAADRGAALRELGRVLAPGGGWSSPAHSDAARNLRGTSSSRPPA
ncbi:methyltransferase domain-containing protein [Streptomyces sp. NPDC048489]|uniref:class I SAM-dependent methyltransferase n=1 Tax=Streptomyces sp. NPDC048489 TaxID=3154504 RepID=UPI00341F8478